MKMELTTRRVCADTEAQLISITQEVEEFVAGCGIENGVCFVISAHTTAGITMNEGLPCVEKDLVDKLETKAHLKGKKVTRYRYLGLFVFVAIPLPGTGAWTGALVAAFLNMPLRKALVSIFFGVVTAGIVVTTLTHGVIALF